MWGECLDPPPLVGHYISYARYVQWSLSCRSSLIFPEFCSGYLNSYRGGSVGSCKTLAIIIMFAPVIAIYTKLLLITYLKLRESIPVHLLYIIIEVSISSLYSRFHSPHLVEVVLTQPHLLVKLF